MRNKHIRSQLLDIFDLHRRLYYLDIDVDFLGFSEEKEKEYIDITKEIFLKEGKYEESYEKVIKNKQVKLSSEPSVNKYLNMISKRREINKEWSFSFEDAIAILATENIPYKLY